MSPLHVVALISGGKDSLFSILHCLANGHKVAALANLYPPLEADTQEDINSYMYQTVGHNVIQLYADALGLPLYRQTITGTAVDKSQSYAKSSLDGNQWQDETESLMPLLLQVKAAYPEVNAVSSGAILSSYQRTRIESIALRMNLTPLAFLWQYPLLPPLNHSSLLKDMAAVGMDARIIKVASGGLNESHLWLNVADHGTITKLERAASRFGSADDGSVLGEGGEYETLAINGPVPLWKKRLAICDDDREVHLAGSGTAAVRINNASLVGKEDSEAGSQDVRIPEVLDAELTHLLQNFESNRNLIALPTLEQSTHKSTEYPRQPMSFSERIAGHHLFLSNSSSSVNGGVHDQLTDILGRLTSRLAAFDLTPDHVVVTTILLRSIADFAQVNDVYSSLFSAPNPPARITIACGDRLPTNTSVSLSVIASTRPILERRGLHVQSRSYWAPANIGPYSQAVADPIPNRAATTHLSRLVHIAGQIPLMPASMELAEGSFAKQAVLALQHLWRVGRAMQVHCWVGAVAFITADDREEAFARARVAVDAWDGMHEDTGGEEDDDETGAEEHTFDVGDAHLRHPWFMGNTNQGDASLAPIPDRTRIATQASSMRCIVSQISELPRMAPIEWVARGLSLSQGEDGQHARATYQTMDDGLDRCTLSDSIVQFHCAVAHSPPELLALRDFADRHFTDQSIHSLAAYVTEHVDEYDMTWLVKHGAQIIPCKGLWDREGEAIFATRYSCESKESSQ